MVALGAPGTAVDESAIILRFLLDGDIPTKSGRDKPNSDFYRASSDDSGTSVIAVCAEEHMAEVLGRYADRLYWRRIDAQDVVGEGLAVVYDPTDEEPLHCTISGWPDGKGARSRVERNLVNNSDWHGEPPPVPN